MEIPPSGYFTISDFDKCEKIQRFLKISGRTAILVAPKGDLLAHYTRLITQNLASLGSKKSWCLQKLPSNQDEIISMLNSSLSSVATKELDGGKSFGTRTIWLAENVNKLNAQNISFASKMLKKLPDAGVALMVLVDTEVSSGFRALLHSLKADRWDFSIPAKAEVQKALGLANSDNDLREVRATAASLGLLGASRSAGARIVEINPKDPGMSGNEAKQSSAIEDIDISSLLKSERANRNAHSKLTNAETAFNFFRSQGGRAVAKMLIGLVLIIGASTIYSDLPEFQKKEQLEMNMPKQSPALTVRDVGGLNLDDSLSFTSETPPESTDSSEKGDLIGDPRKTGIESIDEEELKSIFSDQTKDTGNIAVPSLRSGSAPLVNPSLAATEVDPNSQFYLQLSAFTQLEGAIISRNNRSKIINSPTTIYKKGKNPELFVVLAGPFDTRAEAETLRGKSTDSFVLRGEAIGDAVLSLSSY